MKPFTLLMAVLFLTGAIACKKDNDGSDAEIVLSSGEALIGEIITARAVNVRPGTTYTWYMSGSSFLDMTDDGSKARVAGQREGIDTIHVNLCLNGRPYVTLSKAIRTRRERFYVPAPYPNGVTQTLWSQTLNVDVFSCPIPPWLSG